MESDGDNNPHSSSDSEEEEENVIYSRRPNLRPRSTLRKPVRFGNLIGALVTFMKE